MNRAMQPVQSEQQHQLERAIAGIKEKFLLGLDARVALFDELLVQMEEANDFRDHLKRIRDESHKIAGVAKTLGFSDLGQMAARVEDDVHDALLLSLGASASMASIILGIDAMLNHMDGLSTGSKPS